MTLKGLGKEWEPKGRDVLSAQVSGINGCVKGVGSKERKYKR